MTYEDIVNVLRSNRRRRQISQEAVALAVGKKVYSTIGQWERLEKQPSIDSLFKWVEDLGYELVIQPRQSKNHY